MTLRQKISLLLTFLLLAAQVSPALEIYGLENTEVSESTESASLTSESSEEEIEDIEEAEDTEEATDSAEVVLELMDEDEAGDLMEATESAEATSSAEIVEDPMVATESAIATESATFEQKSENEDPDESKSEITTGDATASAEVFNEANTTISGADTTMAVVTDQDGENEEKTIDLSHLSRTSPCTLQSTSAAGGSEEIVINNYADFQTFLELEALTGGNELDAGDLITGDASVDADIFNLINTSLIGDCWFFGLITLFEQYEGDIYLPYEGDYIFTDYLDKTVPTIPDFKDTKQISVSNSGESTTDVKADADTGNNEAQDVITGDATTEIDIIADMNSTRIGDNWLLIEVRNAHLWNGNIVGLDMLTKRADGSYFFWLPYSPQNYSEDSTDEYKRESSISVNNEAIVSTGVTAKAATGGNKASSIETGDAKVDIDILDIINTTHIGNQWYYTGLTLFDNFKGNLVFSRADLELTIESSLNASIQNIQVDLLNKGRVAARNTTLTAILESEQGEVLFSAVQNPGLLHPAQAYTWSIQVNKDVLEPGIYTLKFETATSIKESSYTNNIASIPIVVEAEVEKTTAPAPEKSIQQEKVEEPVPEVFQPETALQLIPSLTAYANTGRESVLGASKIVAPSERGPMCSIYDYGMSYLTAEDGRQPENTSIVSRLINSLLALFSRTTAIASRK